MAESSEVMEKQKALCDSLFEKIESFKKDPRFTSQQKNVQNALLDIQSLARQFSEIFEGNRKFLTKLFNQLIIFNIILLHITCIIMILLKLPSSNSILI